MQATLRCLAVPALLLIAGCGGSAATGGSGGAGAINVEAHDFMFSPTTISAKAGDKVTVTIKNSGSYEHNFSITELGVSQDVEKGDTKTVTFTASGNTNLKFFCKYHSARGMVGMVDLGGGSAPAGSSSTTTSGSDTKSYGSSGY
jgi:plastocyanin